MQDAVAFDLSHFDWDHADRIVLPNGTLRLKWRERDWRLDELCTFAVRENRRRGFLIVSRVLGRHLPARPAVMRASSDALAALLPDDLPGPVLFVGMAETAITLGQAVHATWSTRSGRSDALYIHSTRQQIGSEPLLRFDEPHSHASSHLLFAPDPGVWPHRLDEVRTLVLVDDEVTTGRTFINLASRLTPLLPKLRQIEIAVLTDWTGGGCLAAMPIATRCHSLLDGTLIWQGDGDPAAETAACTGRLGNLRQRRNFGRLGCQNVDLELDPICARFGGSEPLSLHVIGTGELHYPAFRLGEALEARGHDVLVQATTRSPARLGGAISAVEQLIDNYDTGVPNFLYNTDQTASRQRIVCHETAPGSLDPALLRPGDLGAHDFGALA